MSQHNAVFSQLLKLISRHEFEALENQHHSGHSFRKASRWSQFVTMAMGQLAGRDSLRDLMALLRGDPIRDNEPDINQMVML